MGVHDLATLEDIAPRYLIRFRQMSAMIDDEGKVVNQNYR